MAELSGKYLVGVYDDDDTVLHAVPKLRKAGVKIQEVYSPFPIHGLDDALGHPRTRIGIAAFMFGVTGCCVALTLMIWTMGIDWPMIVGGKDSISLPNYIPITFELTVLFTAFGMVITFFISNGLGPGTHFHERFDVRATDNKFVMAINLGRNSMSEDEISRALRDSGAEEVNIKQF
ncbi:DUF3341 domain-containing protein [Dyadobacter subterraneus]|uniref:Quinol:cytochrome c oxidoreductase membrane protein n=2 Tax=Dyadobacter TaxID=120831 RepID=A0A1H6ZKQ5_9BACT|nr:MULTISPECIES: DUF3341 domain-containing protein [Dyadobacter]MBE9465593.1 DUF3341 domain-containing protein [Dyadobacter subterraneus]SEJ53981.1 quinol:cytochrome c oxidoreductase membrane protein [Dyadobacter koreensis]